MRLARVYIFLTWTVAAIAAPVDVLIQKVERHYNQAKTLSVNFTEEYSVEGRRRPLESGVLTLRKQGKMRWDYKSKAGKVFVLDGKFAWFYAPGDPVVQRVAASKLDDLRSPLRFLLGHTRIENELSGLTVSPSTAGSYLLLGLPKGMEKRVARLTLTVTEAGAIAGISLEELDGAKTSFVFTAEEPNPKIPEQDFRFALPAGVPVVDAPAPV